ncbi:MAG: hypothetical protein Q9221_008943 [Calogaya cf. arnoldii]
MDYNFQVLLPAHVIETWRDDNGFGREDSDYLTMSLEISSWPQDNNTLLARIPHSKDSDKPEPLLTGKTYCIKGGLYLEVPEKDWHQTYLRITWRKEIPEEACQDDAKPMWSIGDVKIARVDEESKQIALRGRVWDEYEAASYGQSILLPFCPEVAADVYKANMNYPWIFQGKMASLEDLEVLQVEWYTPS